MPTTDPSVEARRNLVLLLSKLPLSRALIARVLNTPPYNISNDINALREDGKEVVSRSATYSEKLECHMQASAHRIEGLSTDIQNAIARELALDLKLQEAEQYAEALVRGMNIERMTTIPFALLWTQKVVDAIYGEYANYKYIVKFAFRRALESWFHFKNQNPENHVALAEILVAFSRFGGGGVMSEGMYLYTNDDIAEPWVHVSITEATAVVIQTVYDTLLSDRQRQVIDLRISKEGGEGLTIHEVGKRMHLTDNRVQVIWTEALGKMRDYLDRHHDISHVSAKDIHIIVTKGVAARARFLETENKELKRILYEAGISTSETYKTEIIEALTKRVDELDLSVRTTSVCKNAGLEFIWQICEKTAGDLLTEKNFGRKSLNEIKEVFVEIGLSLGMKISDEIKQLTAPKSQ